MGGMKSLLLAIFVALLMVGCGEEAQKEAVQEEAKDDPSVPLLIPCEACGKEVSKKTEKCLNCGHPAPDSVVAYKEAQELKILAEERHKRWEEEQRLPAISRAEEEAKAQAKHIGLDDHTIILNAVYLDDLDDAGDNYTGWVKEMHDNGQIKYLEQFKDGKKHGLLTFWYENGQKKSEGNFKDDKKHGLHIIYYEDGKVAWRFTYKDGELVKE